jgi:hypothetical protein
MKNIYILLFSIIIFEANCQDTISKACYYSNVNEFVNNEGRKSGKIIEESSTDVTFYYHYTKLTFNSKKIWGYTNNEGIHYRSIDFLFYEFKNDGKLVMYRSFLDGLYKFKISLGLNMIPIDLSEENLSHLISNNKELYDKYNSLSKKDKKSRIVEFINLYNSELEAN